MNLIVINIAHRGGAGLAPENTLTCFKTGSQYADMIEFDIQPSQDHYILVFHDWQGIERTSNGSGKIIDHPYSYLQSLDVGSWFHPKFTNERIPTLYDTIEILTKISSTILFNIELKYLDSSNWFEKSILEVIDHFKIEERTFISARHLENIFNIQEINPEISCILLQKERHWNDYLDIVNNLGLNIVQIRRTALIPEFFEKCQDQGIKIFYFYADTIPEMKKAIDLGVDGILTNFPNRLRDIQENMT
ncbi:glycerophosphodiester phosphodiesterase [Candidatus Hodarchaeum mangrovi]